MFTRIYKTIGCTVLAALCLLPAWSYPTQEDEKPAKKPQTMDLHIEVTDSSDGSPLDNVQVFVKWGEKESDSERAVTDSNGIAKLKDIPRGPVTIRLIAKGYKTVAPSRDLKTEKQPIKLSLAKV